jgi:hypothetical protein
VLAKALFPFDQVRNLIPNVLLGRLTVESSRDGDVNFNVAGLQPEAARDSRGFWNFRQPQDFAIKFPCRFLLPGRDGDLNVMKTDNFRLPPQAAPGSGDAVPTYSRRRGTLTTVEPTHAYVPRRSQTISAEPSGTRKERL